MLESLDELGLGEGAQLCNFACETEGNGWHVGRRTALRGRLRGRRRRGLEIEDKETQREDKYWEIDSKAHRGTVHREKHSVDNDGPVSYVSRPSGGEEI